MAPCMVSLLHLEGVSITRAAAIGTLDLTLMLVLILTFLGP